MMEPTTRRKFLSQSMGLAAAGASLAASPAVHAQAGYPDRPVRIVVAWPPGGNADLSARIIATKLAERLGQQFVVENKPGASTIIGTDAVAKSAADGYTLLVNINTALSKYMPRETKPPYDAGRDLVPLFGVSYTQLFLAVNTQAVPSTTLREFIAFAKGKRMAYGSYGLNTTPHFFAEMVNRHAQLGMAHLPYKGESPMLADLVGGQVQMGFVSFAGSRGFVREGKLRLLAVVGHTRSEFAPEIPTVTEAGVPGVTLTGSIAFYAPARTPEAILRKLEAAGREAVMLPDVQERFRVGGNTPWPATSADLGKSLDDQDRQWQALLSALGA